MANHWLSSARAAEIPLEPLPANTAPLRPPPLRDSLRRNFDAWVLPSLAGLDAAAVMGAFALTYGLRFRWHVLAPAPAPPWGPYVLLMPVIALIWTVALGIVGLYRPRRVPSKFDDLALLVGGLSLGAVCSLALGFLYRDFSYSRLVVAYGYLFSLAGLGTLHLGLRLWQQRVLAQGALGLNTLVVGCNGLGIEVAGRLMRHAHLGFRVVGFVPAPGEDSLDEAWALHAAHGDGAAIPVGCSRLLGRSDQLAEILERYAIDEVILARPGATFGEFFEVMAQASGLPVRFRIVPDLVELVTAKIRVSQLDGVPTLEIGDVPLRKWWNRALKRTLDVTCSALALAALSPLLAVVAVAVKASSPGPVFYRQERLGRDGRTFPIFKFRTMVVDAEARSGPVWATADDPRRTRVGAFLRRYSLDELPQFWNVFRGDMSLVGPRPERPFFVDRFRQYVPKYMDRHLVRSGLTGWAQINGLRGEEGSIEERTRYDIYYIENWSVLFDLKILATTALEVLGHKAY